MKIGFDISQIGSKKTGCGYFTDNLIQALLQYDKKNNYILYKTFGNFFWDPDFLKTPIIQKNNVKYGIFHKNLEEAQLFWKQPIHNIANALGNPTILHSNNYFAPEKKLLNTKFIYTLYDLSFMRHPEWSTEQNRFFCVDNVFNASLHADHIISISEYSKNHFLNKFPYYPEEKINVIYPVGRYKLDKTLEKPERFKNIPLLLSKNFWLKTGTLEPRKNHKLLLSAYAKLKAEKKDIFPLVLTGGEGWIVQDFQKWITELNLQENIINLGYVSEQELQWLYQNCYCFLYPSLFEGFGLPVLEAMTCGAPVITSNTSSIPEITGNAAILIDPNKDATLLNAMSGILTGEYNTNLMRLNSIEQARKFSSKNQALDIIRIYESCF